MPKKKKIPEGYGKNEETGAEEEKPEEEKPEESSSEDGAGETGAGEAKKNERKIVADEGLCAEDACKLLGVGRAKLESLVADGKLPCTSARLPSGRIMMIFQRAEVESAREHVKARAAYGSGKKRSRVEIVLSHFDGEFLEKYSAQSPEMRATLRKLISEAASVLNKDDAMRIVGEVISNFMKPIDQA